MMVQTEDNIEKTVAQEEEVSTKPRWLKVVKEYAYIPITLLLAYLLAGVIFIFGIVPTASMEPTYHAGSLFFGLRLVDEENLERGQTVLFHYDAKTIFLKRVIGLPGDEVTFRDGAVYINGERLDESAYLDSSVQTNSKLADKFVVPENCYFMLGDNRTNSNDSRFWENPYVSSEAVVGRPLFGINLPFWDGL